jgi:multicomponent Na+:H+ antiporter subunit D
MYLAMAAASFFCLLHGIMPGLLYDTLPYTVNYAPYTLYHLVETSQILIFTFAAFWIFRNKLAGKAGISLDVDWFYRRPAGWAKRIFIDAVEAFFNRVERMANDAAVGLARFSRNPAALFPRAAGEENFSPDAHRPAIKQLILVALFGFLLFSAWGLLR